MEIESLPQGSSMALTSKLRLAVYPQTRIWHWHQRWRWTPTARPESDTDIELEVGSPLQSSNMTLTLKLKLNLYYKPLIWHCLTSKLRFNPYPKTVIWHGIWSWIPTPVLWRRWACSMVCLGSAMILQWWCMLLRFSIGFDGGGWVAFH